MRGREGEASSWRPELSGRTKEIYEISVSIIVVSAKIRNRHLTNLPHELACYVNHIEIRYAYSETKAEKGQVHCSQMHSL
jgi:hypothetical protein